MYDVTSYLATWSHVPSGGSLFLVPCSFQWGSMSGGSLSRGSLSRGSLSTRGFSVERHPPGIRKAGDTHPTGMHSCSL